MEIPKSHPRYVSLMTRHRLVEGFRRGLTAAEGLIAHGRGEALDYLLGERTTEFASKAQRAAAAALILARRPVISVNGNVGALVPEHVSRLANDLDCPAEVNIFHRTDERVRVICDELRRAGCRKVLGESPDERLPFLDHPRAVSCSEGIYNADTVLVPLEDGDRAEVLVRLGKKVITIDLNPLSRTAKAAHITIVNNVVRAVPELADEVSSLRMGLYDGSHDMGSITSLVDVFSNSECLEGSLALIRNGPMKRSDGGQAYPVKDGK
jgi:4-phosphopantoate--beta-alanine ligase